jgi:hypothetical protein
MADYLLLTLGPPAVWAAYFLTFWRYDPRTRQSKPRLKMKRHKPPVSAPRIGPKQTPKPPQRKKETTHLADGDTASRKTVYILLGTLLVLALAATAIYFLRR